MGLARRISGLILTIAAFFLSAPSGSASGPWDEAASQLADQIVARLGQDLGITFEVKNRSTVDANDFIEAVRTLRVQMRARKVRVLDTKRPVPGITVTLSENPQGLLWIAEIRRGDAADVVMIQTLKPETETSPANLETLLLRKSLVFEERVPILDLAPIAAAGMGQPLMLVLDTNKVALYAKQATGWVLQQSQPIQRYAPWPRDPRGRLAIQTAGAFTAFTPGTECQGTTAPAWALNCAESQAGWPLGASDSPVARFVSNRNYFDGKLKTAGQDSQVPEFFTSAAISAAPSAFTVFANLDGRARMFGKGPQPAAIFDGWGSEIAAIHSSCAEGYQILAARAGDLTQPDSIQAFSIRGREAVQASAPVEFRGPVTALWTAQDGTTALAVAHDLATGMYDAFSISITCGR